MSAEQAAQTATGNSTFERGMIDHYHIVYEHGPTSWGAYSDDVPGCFAVGKTREEVEQRMREAIALHLSDEDGE